MLYFDHAATTLHRPPCVAQAMWDAMGAMGNADRGAHGAALQGMRTIYDARCSLARLFHCPDPRQVAFTSNATEALNTAINGLFSPGDHVITTAREHNSVLRPLYRLEAQGVSLTILPADRLGNVPLSAFEKAITPATRGIVCAHASNLTGNLLDVHALGQLCRARGIHLVVDAAQTAGVFPIDLMEDGISVLCFTGHKSLMGPQGTGGLCLRPGVSLRPLKVGGSGIRSYDRIHPDVMPTALEAGTLNGHGIAGLGAAVDWILKEGMDALRLREQSIMERFYNQVMDLPGVTVYGDFSTWNRAAIVSLNLGAYNSGAVSDELYTRFSIATRPGAHCAPLMHLALGTQNQGAVRFSFSPFNTEEEVDTAVAALTTLATEEEQ